MGDVIAKVPSVALEMDSPFPKVRSPVIVASPLVVMPPPFAIVIAASPSV